MTASNRVRIKTDDEIERMRQSGQLLARVFAMLDQHIRPGITTMDINQLAERYIIDELNARPASKGQYGYPYALNTSVNHVVCHGMPDKKQRLKETDIVNVDITLEKQGFITDSSKMYVMPRARQDARRLVKQTYQAMFRGIEQVRPGATLGDIGHAIQHHAETAGYSVVREYCGHGIGREMHEAPDVLHYGRPDKGLILKPGMTFTIEPMINQGTARTKTLADEWTVITRDRKLSAQWEHTILVTPTGYEVLTLREEEKSASG